MLSPVETRLANGARGEEKRKEKEEEGVIAERRRVTHFPTRGSGRQGRERVVGRGGAALSVESRPR